jgi:endonuclease YncB( thermonuclease family)
MRSRYLPILTVIALILSTPGRCFGQDGFETVAEEIFAAQVSAVTDELALVVRRDGERVGFRLASVCLPAPDHPTLRQATSFLEGLRSERAVEAHLQGYDSASGVPLGWLLVAGQDVRVTLLERGLACYCRRQKVELLLQQAQQRAHAAKLGVWADRAEGGAPDESPCRAG